MADYQTRLLAFYLPQYHPIPENDAWWGKGFTEWTNVAKARALFPGHYQPHIPADLGFYDLRLPEIRIAQANLAREYGIFGFVYYHYWFAGKRLLALPLDQVLDSREPDFPFCLCWANENWTRVWDGRNREILIEQVYSEQDDLEHIRWLAKVFRDPRYIRISGKPLFLVYRANALPNPLQRTTLWRAEARRLGAGELFLVRVESHGEESGDPIALGFDAAVEFQPNGQNLPPRLLNPLYGDHMVFSYPTLVEREIRKPPVPYKRYPCVTPGWDNSARRANQATIYLGSTPLVYEMWLKAAIAKGRDLPDEERIVFINAWNEWGEGNHLEPDLMYGRKYLEATRRALDSIADEDRDLLVADLIEHHRHYVGALERDEARRREEMAALDRWAHELEAQLRARDAVLKTYSRWLGPFARLARLTKGALNKLLSHAKS